MELTLFTLPTVLLFLLMTIRIAGLFIAAPFFNATGIPGQIITLLAVVMAFLMFPIYAQGIQLQVTNLWEFSLLAVQEFILGALIGLAASLVFAAMEIAGHHISLQMGMGMAEVMDPMTRSRVPVISTLFNLLALVYFLSMNLHHSFIVALARSFERIPLAGGFTSVPMLAERFIAMTADLFVLSIVVVMPVLGILLIMEVVLAFTAKIMPQINIFMVSLPLKIVGGLVLLYLTLPFFLEALGHAFADMVRNIYGLYQV